MANQICTELPAPSHTYRIISYRIKEMDSIKELTGSGDQYRSLGMENLYSSFGERIRDALNDSSVSEIMLNCDGSLFIEHRGGKIVNAGVMGELESQSAIRTLASILNKNIDLGSPILSGEIPPTNARFEGLLPPLVDRPCFSIRKHNALDLTLGDLSSGGMMTAKQEHAIRRAVAGRRSIIVMGQTGTGKTTFLNALLNELSLLCPDERLISIEDTRELCVRNANHLNLQCTQRVDFSRLVKSALRLRPDRIVLGEIRGKEALDLVDAFSTGHEGSMATLHAGSVEKGLSRLCLLVSRHEAAPRYIEQTVAGAVDLLVLIRKYPYRHVASLVEVEDFCDGKFVFNSIGE